MDDPTSLRKLASVQVVEYVTNHHNANNLDIVRVMGWDVIVTRGDIFEGDKIVYFEIDALLPDAYWLPSNFRSRSHPKMTYNAITGKRGMYHRIRSAKIRSHLSQGFLIKIDDLPLDKNLAVDTDVTAILNVGRWMRSSDIKSPDSSVHNIGDFPLHLIPKSDEPRIQSYTSLGYDLVGLPYVATYKYDGKSGSYLIVNNTILVCSRNQIKEVYLLDGSSNMKTDYGRALTPSMIKLLRDNPGYRIQGELCGPKIQKNPLALPSNKFFVYNIYTDDGYLVWNKVEAVCNHYGVDMVPVYQRGDSFSYTGNLIDYLTSSACVKYPSTLKWAEGLVYKSLDNHVHFKIINNQWLMKSNK